MRAIAFLERFSRLHGSKQTAPVTSLEGFSNAENFILISAQYEVYGDEIDIALNVRNTFITGAR